MESLLVWWNLTWTSPDRFPVYSTRTSLATCMHMAHELVIQYPDRDVLGAYLDEGTHAGDRECRIIIYPRHPTYRR